MGTPVLRTSVGDGEVWSTFGENICGASTSVVDGEGRIFPLKKLNSLFTLLLVSIFTYNKFLKQ
jgi:hypothetical protein